MIDMYRGMYKVKGRSKRALKRSLTRLPKMSTKRSRTTTPMLRFPPFFGIPKNLMDDPPPCNGTGFPLNSIGFH